MRVRYNKTYRLTWLTCGAGGRPAGNRTADLIVSYRLHYHSIAKCFGIHGAPHCL